MATIYFTLSKKADKVTGATNGNLAGLDGTGNLTDSGKKPADFAPSSTTYSKSEVDALIETNVVSMDMNDNGDILATYGTEGNIDNVTMDENGDITITSNI